MATTVGVVSLLEGPARDEALRLWQLFETEYGSRGVQTFPHPHLTFHAGACLDVAELDDALAQAATLEEGAEERPPCALAHRATRLCVSVARGALCAPRVTRGFDPRRILAAVQGPPLRLTVFCPARE